MKKILILFLIGVGILILVLSVQDYKRQQEEQRLQAEHQEEAEIIFSQENKVGGQSLPDANLWGEVTNAGLLGGGGEWIYLNTPEEAQGYEDCQSASHEGATQYRCRL